MYYLAFLHYIGINHKKFFLLFEKNRDYKKFFENITFSSLKPFFKESEILKILENYKKIDISIIQKKLDEREVKIITFYDENYPSLLKELPNPPYFLYVRGNINNSPKLAIIGSRTMTSYGEKVIKKIVPDLVKYFTIVSGGAFGCDTQSHIETLNNNGKTIAIIGTGIDIDYPTGNKKIYDEISKNGAVVSIFPIGELGKIYNFPIRNEIISGLSSGVIIIEAKEKSGTLITANLALEQGKDLFCVPGDIFRGNSFGCNNLIKNGNAKIVLDSNDILEEYNISTKNNKNLDLKITFSNDLEKIIYDSLLIESFDINDLIEKLGFSLADITVNISMMEINGMIKKNNLGKYEVV